MKLNSINEQVENVLNYLKTRDIYTNDLNSKKNVIRILNLVISEINDYDDRSTRASSYNSTYNSEAKPVLSLNPVLVHPDEFVNASSFFKVYIDPLCLIERGNIIPRHSVRGNWKCYNCKNVNFPRRYNCYKCRSKRSSDGDQIVRKYAINVYSWLSDKAKN